MNKRAQDIQALKNTLSGYLSSAGEWARKNPEIVGAALAGTGGALLSGGGLGRRALVGLGAGGLGYFAGSQYKGRRQAEQKGTELQKDLTSTRQDLTSTQQQFEDAKTNNASIQGDLRTKMQELRRVQEGSRLTQEELLKTRNSLDTVQGESEKREALLKALQERIDNYSAADDMSRNLQQLSPERQKEITEGVLREGRELRERINLQAARPIVLRQEMDKRHAEELQTLEKQIREAEERYKKELDRLNKQRNAIGSRRK